MVVLVIMSIIITLSIIIDKNTNRKKENCKHDFIITSEFDTTTKSFKIINKCKNCGYKI